ARGVQTGGRQRLPTGRAHFEEAGVVGVDVRELGGGLGRRIADAVPPVGLRLALSARYPTRCGQEEGCRRDRFRGIQVEVEETTRRSTEEQTDVQGFPLREQDIEVGKGEPQVLPPPELWRLAARG